MFWPEYNIKYRRKYVQMPAIIWTLLLITVLLVCIDDTIGKCTNNVSHTGCMNGGACINGTCVCPDGWQGDECQFCGGKVR